MISVSAVRPGAGFRAERGSDPASINSTLVYFVWNSVCVCVCLSLCAVVLHNISKHEYWLFFWMNYFAGLHFSARVTIQANTTCASMFILLSVSERSGHKWRGYSSEKRFLEHLWREKQKCIKKCFHDNGATSYLLLCLCDFSVLLAKDTAFFNNICW